MNNSMKNTNRHKLMAMGKPIKAAKGGMAEGGHLERLGDEPQNFKEAFREARGEGASTFTWQGKKFSTALDPGKKDTTSDTREAGRYATLGKAATDTQRQVGPDESELADSTDREARRERMMKAAALGMGAVSAAGMAKAVAKMLAARGMGRSATEAMDKAATGTQRQVGPVRRGMDQVREKEASATAARKDRAYDEMRSSDMPAGYRKGGFMKKSMGMRSMPVADAFPMRKAKGGSATADRQGRALMTGKMGKNLPMIAPQSAYAKGGEAKPSAYDRKQDKAMQKHASKPMGVAHKAAGKKHGGMTRNFRSKS